MLVRVEACELLRKCGIVRSCVVVLLLVEEFVMVLPEGSEEFHPYHALELVHDSCGVLCGGHCIHPSFPNVPMGHHTHSDCQLLCNCICNWSDGGVREIVCRASSVFCE